MTATETTPGGLSGPTPSPSPEAGGAQAGLASHSSGDMLVLNDGSRWGPFTSHWAATAAMIRLGDPTFKSLGGDKEIDLAIERDIRAALAGGRR